ncbi:MAG TPA: BamA/TamA family outer membrane protein [Verrucomicrobiae bacterium]|nr:BamA/TamA family outer membrane protein [Verrucomicrobiae bacterium]
MENLFALNRGRWLIRICLLWAALAVSAYGGEKESTTNRPAKVKVSGFGFVGNREMGRLLRDFQVSGKMPVIIDRAFVEDAALVLVARATDEGYLQATLRGDFTMTNGSRQQFLWTNVLDIVLPPDFAARSARFELVPEVRSYYRNIQFEGLEALSRRQALSYFVGTDVLLQLKRNRIFTPRDLNSSLAALREAYNRIGYQNASVNTNKVVWNEKTGAVDVGIEINEGLPVAVRSVEVTIENAEQTKRRVTPDKPYSEFWQQNFVQSLRREQQMKGYPDTTVAVKVLNRETNGTSIHLDLAAQVNPGNLVRLGEVIFKGNTNTKTSVLESRVKLEEGEPLNVVEAEASRQRLAQLGIFNSVSLQYEEIDEQSRNVVYEFREGKEITLSVLGGYGSYEKLRGGLEFQDRNVLGLAHDVRIRGVQSFKSSEGDLLYTVPAVFGSDANLFVQGSGLLREEVTFTRKEYGGGIGMQKRIVPIRTDLSVRYDYQLLNAVDFTESATNRPGVDSANAAAIIVDMNYDRRDHPLLPQSGLKLFCRTEFATEALGGNVDYQRLICGASYHYNLHGGRLLHLGLLHGMTFTLGGDSEDLPFNKRFFPGGANSVRGYQEGEASPLDPNGAQLGAETFTQVNIELEQILTRSWSFVVFFDGVGFAASRDNYPWDEGLYSVGGGIHWRTIVGPIRLEYGYNLDPRPQDPTGTLHFSIGAAF